MIKRYLIRFRVQELSDRFKGSRDIRSGSGFRSYLMRLLVQEISGEVAGSEDI